MTRRRLAPLWATALILMLVAGCDNVEWGGAQVTVVPPPPQPGGAAAEEEGPAEERLPTGPVLYYVRSAGAQATMLPVAEIVGDSLRPVEATADWVRFGQHFIAANLREGLEFALFHHGARAGTFIVQGAGVPPETVCPRVPIATGVLELVPGEEQPTEYLALAKPHAPAGERRRALVTYQPDRRMQLIAPILAERLLRARNAPLPGNWTRAMAQLQPFPLADATDLGFASTFLVGDTLGPGLDDEGYSLFFIARPVPQVGYDTAYVEFNDYARTGKAAPRVVDFLDWDRDGETELLLEVYGTGDAWFEALGRVDSGWRRILRTRCEQPAAAAAPPADSAAG